MTSAAREGDRAPEVVVLIVNYNSVAVLERCLGSLAAEPVTRVAVLENGTSPQEWERLLRVAAQYPRVTVHRSEENLGFGGGVNRLYEEVAPTGDTLLWLLNPDTIVTPGTTESLVGCVTNGEGDIVCPRIMTGQPPRVWFDDGRVDVRVGRTRETRRAGDAPDRVPVCQYVTGAAMMLSAVMFRELGGFDARLFLYWEDVDLSLRARRRGARLGVDMRSTIWHQEGGSSKPSRAGRALVYFYVSRNRILVSRRPGSRGVGLVLGPGSLTFLRLVAHALCRGGRGRWARALAVLRGAIDALRDGTFVPSGTLAGKVPSP